MMEKTEDVGENPVSRCIRLAVAAFGGGHIV